MTTSGPLFRLRWSPIDGPELRCQHCGEWWSIGEDAKVFWRPRESWAMCVACINERARLYQAIRRIDPEFRASEADRHRKYYAALKRTAPQCLPAYRREKMARARVRARNGRAA